MMGRKLRGYLVYPHVCQLGKQRPREHKGPPHSARLIWHGAPLGTRGSQHGPCGEDAGDGRRGPLWDFRRRSNGHVVRLLRVARRGVRERQHEPIIHHPTLQLGKKVSSSSGWPPPFCLCHSFKAQPLSVTCIHSLGAIQRKRTRLFGNPSEQVGCKTYAHLGSACSNRRKCSSEMKAPNVYWGSESHNTHNTHIPFISNECEKWEGTAVSRNGHRVEGPNRGQSQKILWLL